mgnify:CR=1 FL=1
MPHYPPPYSRSHGHPPPRVDGLLDQDHPDPDPLRFADPNPLWGRPQVPQSLISAAEEYAASPLGQMTPLEQQREINQQRAMAGDPNYASIGPAPSRGRRLLDQLRSGSRVMKEFGQGLARETPRGLLDIARTLGAESVGGPGGWITDIIDSPSSPRAPDTPAGRAGGMGGMFLSEVVAGLPADAAAAARGVGELRDPEGSTAIGSLELLSAVPGFGLLATGPLRTARMAARIEAEAAARAAEAAEVARRAARDAADPFDDLGIRASTRVEPSRPPPGEAAEIGPLIARDAETGLLGRGPTLASRLGLDEPEVFSSLRHPEWIPDGWKWSEGPTQADGSVRQTLIAPNGDSWGGDTREIILNRAQRDRVELRPGYEAAQHREAYIRSQQPGILRDPTRIEDASRAYDEVNPKRVEPEPPADVRDFVQTVRDRQRAATPPPPEGTEWGPIIVRDPELGLLGRGPIDELSDDTARRILYAVDRQGEWGDLTGPELREAFAALEAEDPVEWAAFLDDPATRLDVPELRTGAPPPSVAEGTPLVAEIGGDRSLLLTRNTSPDQGQWRITPVVGDTDISRGQHWAYETYDEAAQALAGSADDVKPLSASGGLLETAGVADVPTTTRKLTPQEKAAQARAEGRARAREDPDIGATARRSERRFLHHTATPERIAAIEREIERGLAIVPEELAHFRNASPQLRADMVESYLRGPRPENFADTILAGASGRGWYDISGQGIVESFGDDAPRFTALLAAQSPNKSVKDNLKYALDTWARWNEAGRPAELTRESARSIIASPLPADFDNSILALNADAGELLRGELKLSGPKVDPFNLDLMGNVNRIVQDTHQARGYGVAQSRIGNVSVNLPMNAMVRNAAAIASRRVGVDLTGANAQEMGWGWIRGLTNAAGSDDAVAALRASQANPNLAMAGDEGMTLAQRVDDNVALGDLMARPEYSELMQRAGVTPPQPRSTPGLGVEIPSGAVRPTALLDTAARIQANKMGLPLLGVAGLISARAAARQRDEELDGWRGIPYPNSGLLAPPGR